MTLRRQTVPPPVPRRPGTRVWNVALKYTRYLRGLVAAPDRASRHPRHPDTQTSSYPSHDGGHSPRAGLSQKYLREGMRRLKIRTRRRSSEAGRRPTTTVCCSRTVGESTKQGWRHCSDRAGAVCRSSPRAHRAPARRCAEGRDLGVTRRSEVATRLSLGGGRPCATSGRLRTPETSAPTPGGTSSATSRTGRTSTRFLCPRLRSGSASSWSGTGSRR